jgi:hypothetical protein
VQKHSSNNIPDDPGDVTLSATNSARVKVDPHDGKTAAVNKLAADDTITRPTATTTPYVKRYGPRQIISPTDVALEKLQAKAIPFVVHQANRLATPQKVAVQTAVAPLDMLYHDVGLPDKTALPFFTPRTRANFPHTRYDALLYEEREGIAPRRRREFRERLRQLVTQANANKAEARASQAKQYRQIDE